MILRLIDRSLNTNISPMVYIMMGVSVFIGFCFATGLLVNDAESVLYNSGVLVKAQWWGALLFVTASMTEIGFVLNKDSLVSLGGFTGFMAWLFATISVITHHHWYVLVTVTLLHLLFHVYIVLATAMGYLRRQPTRR